MKYTASHWGVYEIDETGPSPRLTPFRDDPDPSPIGLHQMDAEVTALRVRRPSIRKSVLEGGPGTARHLRGREPFVEVEWDEAIDLVAREVDRVRTDHGNNSIYGGSYGWASAGRFHHAQSQVHRFLNVCGGYVSHRDSYSIGAGRVLLPHIVDDMHRLIYLHTSWDVLAEHTELFIAFGGVPAKNAQIAQGLAGRHRIRPGLQALAAANVEVVNISPVADNLITGASVKWIKVWPGSDTAMMLGLAHELRASGRHDRAFLASHCVGWERFEAYLTGATDGIAKTADWAAAICGITAEEIRNLAYAMGTRRTMINVAWALQRSDHGEQPFWMVVTLAAMLGQIGLPGGGFGVGYGATNLMGSAEANISGPSLPQGRNPVADFIPVARIADLLLNPGKPFTYNGETRIYPDIRLVYWAGGNPFHHHQDLTRLSKAWERPETIVVNEQFWTAAARRADIVLPATTTLEREDIGYATREGIYMRMRRITDPVGESLDDFEIFRRIAAKLGHEEAFTEGRDVLGWLNHMHDRTRQAWSQHRIELPDFETFTEQGLVDIGARQAPHVMLAEFRADPVANPLPTPSGRIEIFSETIAGFLLDDCPGHATWFPPTEWHGSASPSQLHLISDQPERRLHSQLDASQWSRAGKVAGREPVFVNPADAQARGLNDGEIVELYNARGACLAGLRISSEIMPGVVRLSTGAWYDPEPNGGRERHGNPNALTGDRGASGLSQGCAAHSCLVELRRPEGPIPDVEVFTPPRFVERAS